MRAKLLLLVCAVMTATAANAQAPMTPFTFSPTPRWAEEPETDALCTAIRAECRAIKDVTDINAEFGYEELYDAHLQLVGVRMTKSTGCKPLDESELLGRRHFRMAFHHAGAPDLDGDLRVDVRAGTDPAAVTIVKASSTQISLGCNPH